MVTDSIEKIRAFFEESFAQNRTLVGEGINNCFQILSNYLDIEILEFESGSSVCTWEIPLGWKLVKGQICDAGGKNVISNEEHPLCVWTGSCAVKKCIPKNELFKNHLIWSDQLPEAIPYKYTYYENNWGFSVAKNMLSRFTDKEYLVEIDSRSYIDSLKIGRFVLPGKSTKKIIICCHLDHPFQLADGLSGAGAAMALIEKMKNRDNLFTYIFLFLPETIGSLAYFSRPKNNVEVCYSIFLDLLSHLGNLIVQKTLTGNTLLDRIAIETAERCESETKITDFRSLPGNDEIVFSAPGIGIPSLLIERWPFKFYHTNMDNFNHYDEKSFRESIHFVFDILIRLEEEIKVISCYEGILNLSKYELWEAYGKGKSRRSFEIATCLMDGTVSYYDIEKISGFSAEEMDKLVKSLSQKGLVAV